MKTTADIKIPNELKFVKKYSKRKIITVISNKLINLFDLITLTIYNNINIDEN